MHQIRPSAHNELNLNYLGRCTFKRNNNRILEPQNVYFRKFDDCWSEGSAQDPTVVKMKGVPKQYIRHLIIEMSYTAGLLKEELFYLLSFLLNLVKLPMQMQQQLMDSMAAQKLIDLEIVMYLQMLAHHPSSALTDNQQEEFREVLRQLKHKHATLDKITFYNPDHIFMKPSNAINPYELEYLNALFQGNKMLTTDQTLYLAKIVYKLQQLSRCERQQYLEFFRDNKLIPFTKFESLIVFSVTRAKRPNRNKLKQLLRELTFLVDIEPRKSEIENDFVGKKLPNVETIEIDYARIQRAFKNIMNSVVPNIVRLTDLQNFLKVMVTLDRQQVVNIFNELKIAKIMTPERFKYLEIIINQRKLGNIDKTKKKEFIQFLRKMATDPINEDVKN